MECALCEGSICCKKHAQFCHSRFHGGKKMKKRVLIN